ncbi:hypothetical protein [Cognatishimia sp. MH4019]|uniref:hypothetical protein n=1 Tax=Cognatishimia sp. MH4019 TaxID=2854030 RepID=UPI001CD5D47D|nr:hypothetical protein [Cognatishimia sp. MH4019]
MKLIWALILSALPLAAPAEPLKIKAADHDAFSRVVFYGQKPDDWAVLKTASGYLLQQSNATFDTSEVFQRMSKARISDLVATDQGVFLQVDCDCHANAFFLEPDLVVVDINDGVSLDLGLTRSALTPQQRAGLQTAMSKPVVKDTPVDVGTLQRDSELAEAVSLAEALLIEQLGRAASQGLASPREDVLSTDIDQITPMTPRDPSVESDILSATTALDFKDPEFEEVTRQVAECIPADWLPSADWSHGDDFTTGLGLLRSQLADATDTVSRARQLALARHYIAHGFTLEAKQLISADMSDEAQLLKQLTALVEQSEMLRPWPNTPEDCPGTSAIWSILAAPSKQIPEPLGKQALRVFPQMPPDLARVIAPKLIEIAYIADQPTLAADMAAQLRYLLGPEGGDIAPTTPLTASSNSVDLLKRARSSDARSPEALIAYVTLQFANQAPLPADIPDLLDAYAFESQGTRIAPRLERAKLMAAAIAGDFAIPFTAQDTMRDDTELQTGAYALLVANGSDMQFLRYGSDVVPTLNPDLQLKMARRMSDLGFYDMAFEWLPNNMAPETRLQRAQVFLESGRFEDALTELAGQSDLAAKELRATLHLRQKSYGSAARAFSAAELTEPALRAVLLANDPALIAEHWTAEQTDLLTSPLPVTTDELVLSKDRDLIELTRQKSASLKKALAAFASP